jgi:uncharacterized protein YjbI with pentapeptide repeats
LLAAIGTIVGIVVTNNLTPLETDGPKLSEPGTSVIHFIDVGQGDSILFDIGDNEISDISPLSNLTSLTWGVLDDNKISDITPLGDLTDLTRLSLPNNQISHISPLMLLPNLRELNLDDNPLITTSINVHLPNPKASDVGLVERNEIQADAVYSMITEEEPVEIRNAVITGPLLSSEMSLPVIERYKKHQGSVEKKQIVSSVSFENCVFTDEFSLGNVVFENHVSFNYCIFQSPVNFAGSFFETDAHFVGTDFNDAANFEYALFRGGEASFTWAEFRGDADFLFAAFAGEASFTWAEFRGDADFKESTFDRNVRFSMVQFNGEFDFRGVHAKGDVDFGGAIINGDRVLFYGAEFDGCVEPPSKFTGRIFGVFWHEVKRTIPGRYAIIPSRLAVESYAAWEGMFSAGGDFADARIVRRTLVRYELRILIVGWVTISLLVALAFALVYLKRHQYLLRRSWRRHFWTFFFFSLDILTPGIGAYKYNWKVKRNISVDKLTVGTVIESAFGWIILGIGATLLIVWLTA